MTSPTLEASGARTTRGAPRRILVVGATFLVSGALLAVAEWMAARGGGTAHFYVFWIAYFLAVAPVVWLLLSSSTAASTRASLVVALGIWSLAPSLLRTGNSPLYFDEFSHFRMLQDLVRTGHPVSSYGLLQIGANFPGLELVSSALFHLSGLTLWISALLIAGVAHVALLAGVYVLVRDATRSSRSGAIAAVVYSLNPSWMFFDAQFSYETLALPIFVWVLVFAMRGIRSRDTGTPTRPRAVQIGLAAVMTGGLVVTHSVTSLVCTGVLVGVAIFSTFQHRGILRSDVDTSPLVAWLLAAWSVLLTTWRFSDVGHPLFVYLGPAFHFSQQFHQLLSLLGIGTSLPVHSAFANSSAPFFEVACAYLMLPVIFIAFVWAVWGLLGARRTLSPLAFVATILGALFFVSLPLASAAAYSEAAHRSWAFSFLGIAIVLGVAGGLAFDDRLAITVRSHRLWPLQASWARRLRPVLAGCVVVVAIGSVSVGTSIPYRFGGQVAPESDPLYIGTETAMVAAWFARNALPGQEVWANRFVVRPIAIASRVDVVAPGGPQLRLLLAPKVTTNVLFSFEHVNYIVFNRFTGFLGGVKAWFWYVPSDSLLPKDERGNPQQGRFGCLDWANAVFATNQYQILKVNTAQVTADTESGTNGLIPGCLHRWGIK